ncbi:hypothetical protein Tco_0058976 [Tanacetum coccineum]
MFAESLQVVGNERCTLTLIPVDSKWSLSLLCIITCPVDCTHADIASCVGANRGLRRQSAQFISVDTQAKDLENILEKWSDEHKKRRETGLKGETKPDLTGVLISILEGHNENKFKQPHGKLKEEIMKKYEKNPRTNATDDYLRMIEQSDEHNIFTTCKALLSVVKWDLASMNWNNLKYPYRLNPGPHHREARLNAQFYTYSKVSKIKGDGTARSRSET